jgi:hypothetical protein
MSMIMKKVRKKERRSSPSFKRSNNRNAETL